MKMYFLNSGGLDSLVTAKLLYSQGHELHSIFLDFNQVNLEREMISAQRIADNYCVDHEIYTIRSNKRQNLMVELAPVESSTVRPFSTYIHCWGVVAGATSGTLDDIHIVATGATAEYDDIEITSGGKGDWSPLKWTNIASQFLSTNNYNHLGRKHRVSAPIHNLLSVDSVIDKGLELGLTLEEMSLSVSCNWETACGECPKCLARKARGLSE